MNDDPMAWFQQLAQELLNANTVHRGDWQSQDVSWSPRHATYEAMDVRILMHIPTTADELQLMTQPNRMWADEHFAERVGGEPVNPPPSHKNWPWARHNATHQDTDDKFSHTYPERFWPRHAGHSPSLCDHSTDPNNFGCDFGDRRGVRYEYGDLNDVVTLLRNKPLTRQAFLPVWFPEDTGATSGQRVPCTIGYHFMTRDNEVHCWYMMRSCDLVRHLQDDVYLAGRLLQWVCDKMNDGPMVPRENTGWLPGRLHMTISSLHAFIGDRWRLSEIAQGVYR